MRGDEGSARSGRSGRRAAELRGGSVRVLCAERGAQRRAPAGPEGGGGGGRASGKSGEEAQGEASGRGVPVRGVSVRPTAEDLKKQALARLPCAGLAESASISNVFSVRHC